MNRIYTLDKIVPSSNSIYLAGPTFRVENYETVPKGWREDAIDYLKEFNFKGDIYIPEYKNNIKPKGWTYEKQIAWELQAMCSCEVILFWIPRNMASLPALTTNIEFGEWLDSGKIIVGAPTNAVHVKYIEERCKLLNIPYFTSLKETVKESLDKLKFNAPKTWFTSDTHFGSDRTLELSRRPFSTVEQMDDVLIKNWNKLISNKDTVIHLGDFGDPKVINHLKGKNILILQGNYERDDKDIMIQLKMDNRVKEIHKENNINFDMFDGRTHLGSFYAYITHEPEFAEDKEKFYLFGHIHQLQMIKRNGLNVGVDCHQFKPIDKQVVEFYRNAILNHYDKNVFMERMGK